MPPGNKAKKKLKQRRYKKRRQLLERSRRSRDDLINSALEETDVVSVVPKLLLNSSRASTACDAVDTPIFGTPSRGDSRRRTLFINSTPRRRPSIDEGLLLVPPNPSTCLVLSPIISLDDEIDKSLLQNQVSSSTGPKTDMWIDFKYLFASFLNSISSIFTNMYLMITTLTHHKTKNSSGERSDELMTSKLDMILDRMTELHLKQDRFYKRQETILSRLAALESKVSSRAPAAISFNPAPAGPPPPPPPPPPPLPILDNLFTPAPLVFCKKPQTTATEAKRTSRPSITVDDILNVQLKKTPAVKPFGERTPVKGQKGPLVSVDMLRSVKLKPANMRRQNLERPLQSPSVIFQEKNSDVVKDAKHEVNMADQE